MTVIYLIVALVIFLWIYDCEDKKIVEELGLSLVIAITWPVWVIIGVVIAITKDSV